MSAALVPTEDLPPVLQLDQGARIRFADREMAAAQARVLAACHRLTLAGDDAETARCVARIRKVTADYQATVTAYMAAINGRPVSG